METNGVVPHLADPTGLSPSDVKSAYGLPDGGGAGAVVGIVDAFDDPNAESDLEAYRAQFGWLPSRTASSARWISAAAPTTRSPTRAGPERYPLIWTP